MIYRIPATNQIFTAQDLVRRNGRLIQDTVITDTIIHLDTLPYNNDDDDDEIFVGTNRTQLPTPGISPSLQVCTHHHCSHPLAVPPRLRDEPVPFQVHVRNIRLVQRKVESPKQRCKDKVHLRIPQVVAQAVARAFAVRMKVLPHEMERAIRLGLEPSLGLESSAVGEDVGVVVDEDHDGADGRAGGNGPAFVLHVCGRDALGTCRHAVVETEAFLDTRVQGGKLLQLMDRG